MRVRGVDVRIEGAAFALPAAVVLVGFAEGPAVAGARALVLAVLLLSLLAHEVGHAVAARARGLPVLDVRLTAVRGRAQLVQPLPRRRAPAGEGGRPLAA